MDKEHLKELLAAYAENRLTPDEEAKLDKALLQSWQESYETQVGSTPTVEGYQRIQRILYRLPRKRKISRRWSIAASILLPLFTIGAWFAIQHTKIQHQDMTVVQADQAQDVALPDGTLVHLFEGAKLSYPQDFDTNREIYLDGEAFFDVARDEKHLFRVHTGSVRTEVLGTAFEVRMDEFGLPLVRVHRGRVRVVADDEASILNKNEQVQIQNGKLRQTSILNNLADFDFHIRNETLSYLTSILIKRFDVDIQILSPKMAQERLTTVFRMGDSIEELLDIISLASGMEWQQNKDTILLKNKDN